MSTQPRRGARKKKRAETKSKASATRRKAPRKRAPDEVSTTEPREESAPSGDEELEAVDAGEEELEAGADLDESDEPGEDESSVDESAGPVLDAPADAGSVLDEEDDEEIVDGIPRDLLDAPDEGEAAIPGEDSAERPGLEKTRPSSVGEAHLKSVLESLVFVSDKPVQAKRLARVARARTKEVERLLAELAEDYRGRGIELVELAGGFQFRSAAANAPFVREIVESKPVRLTRAQLETLAISAYRQPLTRPELEEIRGVDSGSALKVLLERGLVKILGRKDEAGRPLLYGTTPLFLEFFGMRSLDELPTLREFSELSDESRALFARKTGEEIGTIGDIAVPEAAWASDDEAVEGEGGEPEPGVEDERDDAERESAGPDEARGDAERGDAEHRDAADGADEDTDEADGDTDDDADEEDDEEDEAEEEGGVDREDLDPGDATEHTQPDPDEPDDDEREEEDDEDEEDDDADEDGDDDGDDDDEDEEDDDDDED